MRRIKIRIFYLSPGKGDILEPIMISTYCVHTIPQGPIWHRWVQACNPHCNSLPHVSTHVGTSSVHGISNSEKDVHDIISLSNLQMLARANILSRAIKAGSPTNRSGSDKTRGQKSFGPSTGGPDLQGSLKRNEPHIWFAFFTKTGWAWHVTILSKRL